VGVHPGECDPEGTVLGGDGGGVVPLDVTRLPVVEVGSFPGGIVAGVETSSVVVKFVGEDQLEFRSVVEGGPRNRPIWSTVVGGLEVQGPRIIVRWTWRTFGPIGYYDTRRMGPAVVEATIGK